MLGHIADALVELRPEQSDSNPDLFGQSLFILTHQAERAIANGNANLIRRVFPQIVEATFVLHEHMTSIYRPPTYEFNTNLLNPLLDVLELSGLAIAYETLRHDRSADPVRAVWRAWHQGIETPNKAAVVIMDLLDLAAGGFHPISTRRLDWRRRLERRIIVAGFGRPDYNPFGPIPEWNAPPLIKMMGVDASMPTISLDPYIIFAALVLGPMSEESEESLRARVALKRYFEEFDRYGESDCSGGGDPRDGENGAEND